MNKMSNPSNPSLRRRFNGEYPIRPIYPPILPFYHRSTINEWTTKEAIKENRVNIIYLFIFLSFVLPVLFLFHIYLYNYIYINTIINTTSHPIPSPALCIPTQSLHLDKPTIGPLYTHYLQLNLHVISQDRIVIDADLLPAFQPIYESKAQNKVEGWRESWDGGVHDLCVSAKRNYWFGWVGLCWAELGSWMKTWYGDLWRAGDRIWRGGGSWG